MLVKMLKKEEILIYENLFSTIGFSLINGCVLAFVQWHVLPHEQIVVWLSSLWLVSIFRSVDYWRFKKGHLPSTFQLSAGVYASALVWGSSSLLLFPPEAFSHQVFLAFVVGGMAAASTSVLAPKLSLVLAYLLISLLPLIIRFLLENSSMSLEMSGMIFLFLISTTLSALRNHKHIVQNIQLKNNSLEDQKVIQQSQDFISKAGELANLGAWTLREDKSTMDWSEQTYKIFQWPSDRTVDIANFLQAVSEEYRADLQRAINQLYEKNGVIDMEVQLENQVWLRLIGQLSESGRVSGAVQDISQQKMAAQALIEAKSKSEQASQAKSRFLNNMSHELRTPLNAILGFSQLLELEDLNDAQKEYLMEVVTAGHHLLDMVNELLEFSRIENNKLKISFRQVGPVEVLEEIQRMIRPAVANYRVVLETQWEEELPQIEVDKLRLVQSISSFINNMVKQSDKGSIFSLNAKSLDDIVIICFELPKAIVEKKELLRVLDQNLSMADGKLDLDSLSLFLLKKFTMMMQGKFTCNEKLDRIQFSCTFSACH